jgi:hypothetical protein
MKPLGLVLAFAPLIAFSVLARLLPAGDFGVAAIIAAAVAAVALAIARPPWPPKIITGLSLALFLALAIIGFAVRGDDSWLATWGGAGVGVVLGLVILALVPVMPFTEQYARESVPREHWNSPTFKLINRVLSTAWGASIVALGASRVVAAVIKQPPSGPTSLQLVFSLVIPVLILVYMLKFTKSYPERVARETATVAQPGPARQ